MKKGSPLLLALMAMTLSGCSMINALQCNREAIEMSTQAICENIQAIEEANAGIEENKRQLERINEVLSGMGG